MYELEEKISTDYRKLKVSKFLIYSSFTVTSFFSIYSFFLGNMKLFYADMLLFFILFSIFLIFRKKSLLLVAKNISIITGLGLLFVIYINNGNDSVMLWAYTIFFPIMFLFGFKKGALITIIYSAILFILCYTWLGENITYAEYIRFLFIGVILAITAYLYEYAIYITLKELNSANNKLNEITKIDSLTTLHNRRYFDEVFPNQIKIARRNKTLLAFAMIDIDYFKNFNDTYGHLAGDEVLKAVANIFKKNLKRPDDYVFRLGGEEFGVLFNTNSKENGIEIIKKVCKSVEDLKIAAGDNTGNLYVTVSIGLYIDKPSKNHEYDDIYKASDNALYEAKLKGRNRVEVA